MNRIMQSKKGSSLVEVLIAIAVLGVFIIPISGMFISSLKTSENSNASVEAYSIANRIIEGIGEDEIYTPYESIEFSDEEYTRFGIRKNAYQVKKTIEISENSAMDSFQSNGEEVLVIDTSVDGEINFLNALMQKITYTPSSTETVTITMKFDDMSVKNGNVIIYDKNFDYVKVIGGNSNLKLVLENYSATDKTLYLLDMPLNSNFSIEMIAKSKARWINYDNLQSTEKNGAGNVAIANLIITVKHIPSNTDYVVESKKVFYRYQDASNYGS